MFVDSYYNFLGIFWKDLNGTQAFFHVSAIKTSNMVLNIPNITLCIFSLENSAKRFYDWIMNKL